MSAPRSSHALLAVSMLFGVVHCSRTGLRVDLPPHSDAAIDAVADTRDAIDAATDATRDIPIDQDFLDVFDATDAATCPPPRPIAPLSTSFVTTRQPTLHWRHAPGDTTTRVDVCADPACAMVLFTDVTTDEFARPTSELPHGIVFWRLSGVHCAASGPTWEFTVPVRSAPTDVSWGSAPDVDGDGYADLFAAHIFGTSAHVYRGGPGGLSATREWRIASAGGGGSGRGPAYNAGDLDGDGPSDVAIYEGGTPPGVVRVFYGGAGGLTVRRSTPLDGPELQFGISMTSLDDIDGDGYGDLLVGAPATVSAMRVAERAYVYRGGPSGLVVPPDVLNGALGSRFGADVSSAGDVNADGFADALIAEEFGPRVLLYTGTPTGLPDLASVTIGGPATSSFGRSMTNAGDLDGDGYSDLAIATSTGSTYVFYGSATGPDPTARQVFPLGANNLGYAMSLGGDIDADGFGDVVIAAPAGNSGSGGGTAFVVYGGTSRMRFRTAQIDAPDGSLGFAWSIAGGGDYDRDGYADVAVGAIGSDQVFVYRGGATGVSRTPAIVLPGGAI